MTTKKFLVYYLYWGHVIKRFTTKGNTGNFMIMVDKFVQDLERIDAAGQTFVLGFMTGMQFGNIQHRERDDASKKSTGSDSVEVDADKSVIAEQSSKV